ncbi:Uncharacterised protein [Mycobacteroides abscessus subsp. abscessus]|nr:Uncharacterised protein [Mycobacteroides abscessus subsp. abscessus]
MNNTFVIEKYRFILPVIITLISISVGLLSIYPLILLIFLTVLPFTAIVVFISIKPDRFVGLLICYVIFQNFIAIIAAKYLGGDFSQFVIIFKDVLVYLVLLFAFCINHRKFKLIAPDIFAFLYFFLLVIYLLVPNENGLFAMIVQFRQLITPISLYLLGRFLLIKKSRVEVYLRVLVKISVIAVIFGLVERYLLGDAFWSTLGIKEYLISKGMEVWSYGYGGVQGNFYTYDLYSIIGHPLRRMVSFVADPTLFGQFLVLPIVILLFTEIFNKKYRIYFSIILIFGLLLTISKGGVLSLLIALTYKLFHSKYKVFGYFAIIILMIALAIIMNNASLFSSLPSHINGLVHNSMNIISKPFGSGLGSSGNFAVLFSTSSDSDIGSGESYIGMVLGQVGVFSILFILFIVSLILFYKKRIKHTIGNEKMNIVLIATLLGVSLSSLISESAISFISAGILFLISGLVTSDNNKS